jgi:outer membrane immunogenic protein
MNIKKHILAAVIAVGIAGAAAAQTQTQWTGYYLGGNVGYGWGTAHVATSTVFSPTGYFATSSVPAIASAGAGSVKPSGLALGVTAGYNFQSTNVVYGGEFDFNYDHNDQTRSVTAVYPCCAPTSFTIKQTAGLDYLSTLRGRIGYAKDRWMIYGTAGAALAKIKYDEVFTDTFATANESMALSKTKLGWTAGIGAEYDLQNKWTLKGEFIHAAFGNISGTSNNMTAFTPAIAFPTNTFSHSTDLKVNLFRFGFNYRF